MTDIPTPRTSVVAALDVVALFDFEGQSAEELSFTQGERLQVLKADSRKKWWYAMNSQNRKGYIPVNFVSFASDEDGTNETHAKSNNMVVGGENAILPHSSENGNGADGGTGVNGDADGQESPPKNEENVAKKDTEHADYQTISRMASGTLTSVRFIEDLLLFKLRSNVITQAEYDQIMETRRSARDLMNADGVGEFAPEHIAGGAIREDFVSPLVSSSNDVSAEASADDAGSDNDDGTIAFPSAASTTAASPLSTRASSAPPASSRPTGTKVGAGTATPIVGLSVDNSELSTDRHEHSSDTGGLSEGKEQQSNDSGQTGGQESKPPRRSSNFSLFGGGSAGGKKKAKKKKTSKPRLGEILVVHPWMHENESTGRASADASDATGSKLAPGTKLTHGSTVGAAPPTPVGSGSVNGESTPHAASGGSRGTEGSSTNTHRMSGGESSDNSNSSNARGEVDGGAAPTAPFSVASHEVDAAAEAVWQRLEPKRLNVVNEIVSTERYYVSILKMLLDAFVKPLREAAQLTVDQVANKIMNTAGKLEYTKSGVPKVVIKERQVRVIFHELESLHAINNLLLEQLEERYATWSTHSTLGDIFLSIMSFLKGYTAFANNFENALKVISDCKKEPSFVAYLSHCAENVEACNKMWLEDHMITPIQRIPRYILLLTDLMKHTHETHPDHQLLAQCVVSMKAIARHINESKKRSEEVLKTIQVQRIVKRCPAIVSPSRMFLFECGCVEMAALDTKEAKAIVDRGAANDDAGVAADEQDDAMGVNAARDATSPIRRGSYMGSVRSASGGGRTAALTRHAVSPVAEASADDAVPTAASFTDSAVPIAASSTDGAVPTAASSTDGAVPTATSSTDDAAPDASTSDASPRATADILGPAGAGGHAADDNAHTAGQTHEPPSRHPSDSPSSLDKTGLQRSTKRRSLPRTPLQSTQADAVKPMKDSDTSSPLNAGVDLESNRPAGAMAPTRASLFTMRNEVALYLFNDALLVATHVRITDLWGKAFESIKTMNRDLFGKDMPVRTVTLESDGNETVHKYKFQRMEFLDLISLSDFPSDELLPNGFVIHFPDGPFYYTAPSATVKAAFLKAFTTAAESYSRNQTEHIQALQKAFSEA